MGLILACYGTWFVAGYWLWPNWPLLALALMTVSIALQSSLMHEASHGHPTKYRWINEVLVGLPIGLVWPYRRFKSLHLRHHRDERLTDPFDDPESYYRARWQYERMPRFFRLILQLNNLMLVRLILGPILGLGGLMWSDANAILAGNKKVIHAWTVHAICVLPVISLLVFVFEIPLWIYVLGSAWPGLSLIAIRTFAEHQWSESPEGRTIIVERSILGLLFLNNNLHIVHHQHPAIPWYQLPSLYWANREKWQRLNNGYVFPNYAALIRKYSFRAKESVIHPVWRRDIEQQFIFLPKGHGHDTAKSANVRAVAKPQKD